MPVSNKIFGLKHHRIAKFLGGINIQSTKLQLEALHIFSWIAMSCNHHVWLGEMTTYADVFDTDKGCLLILVKE